MDCCRKDGCPNGKDEQGARHVLTVEARLPESDGLRLSEEDEAAQAIRDALADAIDANADDVRKFQAELCDSGALRQLYALAVARRPLAFEALRLLAYRNRIVVQQLANMGAIELLEQILVREPRSGVNSSAVHAAALQLLTSLLAFNLGIHSQVMRTKLVKRLVQLCRSGASDALQPFKQPQQGDYQLQEADRGQVQSPKNGYSLKDAEHAICNTPSQQQQDDTTTARTACLKPIEAVMIADGSIAASIGGAASDSEAAFAGCGASDIEAANSRVAVPMPCGAGQPARDGFLVGSDVMRSLQLQPRPSGSVSGGSAATTPRAVGAGGGAVTSPSGRAHPDAPVILSQEQQSTGACAAVALRNLCHQISNHPGLLSAGAALELATVMQREPDPYRRINATMAVALLVGHEEQHPLMRIDERGLREMLMVLACSRAKVMCHGYFWTCWKVCQALARLSANEDNKPVLTREGGVELLADVILSEEHSRKAITVKYCVEALWNLAFYEPAREQILANAALVGAICTARQSSLDLVREVARGCLFTLGVTEVGMRRSGGPHGFSCASDSLAWEHAHHQDLDTSQHQRPHATGEAGAPPSLTSSSRYPSHPNHPPQRHARRQDVEELEQLRLVEAAVSTAQKRAGQSVSVPSPPPSTVMSIHGGSDGGTASQGPAGRPHRSPSGSGADDTHSHTAAAALPPLHTRRQDTNLLGDQYGPVVDWHPHPHPFSPRRSQRVEPEAVGPSSFETSVPETTWHYQMYQQHQQHQQSTGPSGEGLSVRLHRSDSCASSKNRATSSSTHPDSPRATSRFNHGSGGYANGGGLGSTLSSHRYSHSLKSHIQSQQSFHTQYQQHQGHPGHQYSRSMAIATEPGGLANGSVAGGPVDGEGYPALGLGQCVGNTGGMAVSASAPPSAAGAGEPGHIMISYEWGSQQKALMIKEALEGRDLHTWMDVEKMSGSTLEAMALAVEGATAVLLCITKRYKESQACRAEAEYAFQQRKRIIPIMMERGYRPTGWLGILVGTKLYFDFSERRLINERVAALERELGPLARLCRRPGSAVAGPGPAGAAIGVPRSRISATSGSFTSPASHQHNYHQNSHSHYHSPAHARTLSNGRSGPPVPTLRHPSDSLSTGHRFEVPLPSPGLIQRDAIRPRRGSVASDSLPEVLYDMNALSPGLRPASIAVPGSAVDGAHCGLLQPRSSLRRRDSGGAGGDGGDGSTLSSVNELADIAQDAFEDNGDVQASSCATTHRMVSALLESTSPAPSQMEGPESEESFISIGGGDGGASSGGTYPMGPLARPPPLPPLAPRPPAAAGSSFSNSSTSVRSQMLPPSHNTLEVNLTRALPTSALPESSNEPLGQPSVAGGAVDLSSSSVPKMPDAHASLNHPYAHNALVHAASLAITMHPHAHRQSLVYPHVYGHTHALSHMHPCWQQQGAITNPAAMTAIAAEVDMVLADGVEGQVAKEEGLQDVTEVTGAAVTKERKRTRDGVSAGPGEDDGEDDFEASLGLSPFMRPLPLSIELQRLREGAACGVSLVAGAETHGQQLGYDEQDLSSSGESCNPHRFDPMQQHVFGPDHAGHRHGSPLPLHHHHNPNDHLEVGGGQGLQQSTIPGEQRESIGAASREVASELLSNGDSFVVRGLHQPLVDAERAVMQEGRWTGNGVVKLQQLEEELQRAAFGKSSSLRTWRREEPQLGEQHDTSMCKSIASIGASPSFTVESRGGDGAALLLSEARLVPDPLAAPPHSAAAGTALTPDTRCSEDNSTLPSPPASSLTRSHLSRYRLFREDTSMSLGLTSDYTSYSGAGGAAGAPSEADSGLMAAVGTTSASVSASHPTPELQATSSTGAVMMHVEAGNRQVTAAGNGRNPQVLESQDDDDAALAGPAVNGSAEVKCARGLWNLTQGKAAPVCVPVAVTEELKHDSEHGRGGGPVLIHQRLRVVSEQNLRRRDNGGGVALLLHSVSGGPLCSLDGEDASTDGQSSYTPRPGGSTGDLLGLPGGSTAAEQFVRTLNTSACQTASTSVFAVLHNALQSRRGNGTGGPGSDQEGQECNPGPPPLLTRQQQGQGHELSAPGDKSMVSKSSSSLSPAEICHVAATEAATNTLLQQPQGHQVLELKPPGQGLFIPPKHPLPPPPKTQPQANPSALATATARIPLLALLRPVTAALVSAAVALAPPSALSRFSRSGVLPRADTVASVPIPFSLAHGCGADDSLSNASTHSVGAERGPFGSPLVTSIPPRRISVASAMDGPTASEAEGPPAVVGAVGDRVSRDLASAHVRSREESGSGSLPGLPPGESSATATSSDLAILRWKAINWASRRASLDTAAPSAASHTGLCAGKMSNVGAVSAPSGVEGDADDLVGERLAMGMDSSSRLGRRGLMCGLRTADESGEAVTAHVRCDSPSRSQQTGDNLNNGLSLTLTRGLQNRSGLRMGPVGTSRMCTVGNNLEKPLGYNGDRGVGGVDVRREKEDWSFRRSAGPVLGEECGSFRAISGRVSAGAGPSPPSRKSGCWEQHNSGNYVGQHGALGVGGGICVQGNDYAASVGGDGWPQLQRLQHRSNLEMEDLEQGVAVALPSRGNRVGGECSSRRAPIRPPEEEDEEDATSHGDELGSEHFDSQVSSVRMGPMEMDMQLGMNVGGGLDLQMELGVEQQEEMEVSVPPSSTSQLVERWRAPQVRDWLVRIGHCGLADRFEEMGITGRALCGLMRVMRGGGGAAVVCNMLRHELGVTGLAAQLELLEELHRLFD